MKYKTGDVVLVEWQDHFSRNCGWKSLSEVSNYAKDEYFCYSTGVIVSLNKKQLVIAQNYHPAQKGWEPQAADFMVILVKCIKSIKLIKKKAW